MKKEINYPRLDFYARQHRARYSKYVQSMPNKLICQDCKGAGGDSERTLDDGTGPWYECGWCEGTGLLTKHIRGIWLNYKLEESRLYRSVELV